MPTPQYFEFWRPHGDVLLKRLWSFLFYLQTNPSLLDAAGFTWQPFVFVGRKLLYLTPQTPSDNEGKYYLHILMGGQEPAWVLLYFQSSPIPSHSSDWSQITNSTQSSSPTPTPGRRLLTFFVAPIHTFLSLGDLPRFLHEAASFFRGRCQQDPRAEAGSPPACVPGLKAGAGAFFANC